MGQPLLIHINVVCWGEEYVRTFVDFCLPFQFAKGNLEVFSHSGVACIYHIYTTLKDYELFFKDSNNFSILYSLVKVEMHFISDPSDEDEQYCIMSSVHNSAIKRADQENAALIFFSPDIVFSEGTLQAVVDLFKKGKRVVAVASIRLAKQDFMQHIEAQKRYNFSSRELAAIALKHLHPASSYLFWDRKHIPSYCANMYWKLDSGNVLIRTFHLHPFLIWPEKKEVLLNPHENIDGFYMGKACPSLGDSIHVVEDSDQLVVFEMTDQKRWVLGKLYKKTLPFLSWWASKNTSEIHLQFVRKKIYIKTADVKPEWQEIEDHSDRVINHILSKLNPGWMNSVYRFLGTPNKIQRILLKFKSMVLWD